MKKFFIILSLAFPFAAYAQQEEKVDTIPSTRLDEVVVTADSQVETAKKVILNPSKLEKKHSTNGYSLLANMNLPDFNVNPTEQTITTNAGRNVIILVNGAEVSADELGTLAASEITQIQYQRNPGGKWVRSGAVINFITVQYDYGGNVYLSTDEAVGKTIR